MLKRYLKIDYWLLLPALTISLWGLLSINAFTTGTNALFEKQFISLAIALVLFYLASLIDFRFLKNSKLLLISYFTTLALLIGLFFFGQTFGGAQSWFALGPVSFQPAELAKLVLVLVLAKYFAKRHIAIADFNHIMISGLYAFLFFLLVFLQPDAGSALILFLIWFGTVLFAGLNWRHLFLLLVAGLLSLGLLWSFVLAPYQQTRIISFINPVVDLQGAGYNSNQAKIAVGSGGLLGKGVGYGTQSRLDFLPESETDFIFASFAEEWGLLGAVALLGLYAMILARVLILGLHGQSNFEMLFAGGLAIMFLAHIFVHVGINIGLLPVTGVTIPFMSYGGSHLLVEYLGLGILAGISNRNRTAHRDSLRGEFVGL